MHSMTGYGKADYKKGKLAVSIELISVNSRFLEFTFRMPKQLIFLEPKIKNLIASKINRGKITISVNYADYGTGIDKLVINKNLSDNIYAQLTKLKKEYKLSGDIELASILGFSDIFKIEKSGDIKELVWPIVKTAAEKSIRELNKMRKHEGDNLKKDLVKRIKSLTLLITKIEKHAPKNVEHYRSKLTKKINAVLSDGTINGKRLEEEIAYLAERSDITEECVRFRSHLDQFNSALKENVSIGKRLNFILQELNRETNTIGAKAAGTEISKVVLNLKEEIEKIREQVQNIE